MTSATGAVARPSTKIHAELRTYSLVEPGTRAGLPASLPVSARVRAKAEFERVFAQGRRYAHPLLALHLLPTQTPGARLGLAVSRKVDPRAVGRNRIKRVLREQFRHHRARLQVGAYVIVVRSAARQADNSSVRAALTVLLQRAGALPLPAATGTMPPLRPRPGRGL